MTLQFGYGMDDLNCLDGSQKCIDVLADQTVSTSMKDEYRLCISLLVHLQEKRSK